MSGTNPILSKLSSGQTFPVTLANGQAIVSAIINLTSDTKTITDNLQSQINTLSSNVQGTVLSLLIVKLVELLMLRLSYKMS